MNLNTLEIESTVGDSIIGRARIGARHPQVEVGKMAPTFRRSEEPQGLVRATFLDPTAPLEVNLLHWPMIRTALQRLAAQYPLAAGEMLNPADLIRARPTITYVPADALTEVHPNGIKALAQTGPVGARIAPLRGRHPDGAFWGAVAESGLYVPWLDELRAHAGIMGASLVAPPVPVVHGDLEASPDGQYAVNIAAAAYWRGLVQRGAAGGGLIEEYLRQRQIGLMYSLHLHPSALRAPRILTACLRNLSEALTKGDNPYWGVHLSLFDMALATRQGRPRPAKEFIREAARIAAEQNVFLWASDFGAVGPIALDLGAAFASYHNGMTPGRVYGPDSGPGDLDLQYGKILEMWSYNLCDRAYVQGRDWSVEDNGLTPNVVPVALRNATPQRWRVGFARPHNTAVAERLNSLRANELHKGNVNPGKAHLGKSNDERIAPWAA